MTSNTRTAINDTLHSLESARRKEDWLDCMMLSYHLFELFSETRTDDLPTTTDAWVNAPMPF